MELWVRKFLGAVYNFYTFLKHKSHSGKIQQPFAEFCFITGHPGRKLWKKRNYDNNYYWDFEMWLLF